MKKKDPKLSNFLDGRTIVPGLYVLTRTIANPKPDKRMRDRWIFAPEWKAGMRFEVKQAWWRFRDDSAWTSYELGHRDERFPGHIDIHVHAGGSTIGGGNTEGREGAVLALLDALAIDTSDGAAFDWLLIANNAEGWEASILYALYQSGAIDAEHIKDGIAAVRRKLDAEQAEIERRQAEREKERAG